MAKMLTVAEPDCDGCEGDRCAGGCPVLEGERRYAAGADKATIGIYGTREVGFAFLACTGGTEVFGDYEPASAKLAHEDMTSALFTACDALRARGVTGRARVTFDRKRSDGRTVVRSAEVDIASPPWAGSLNWKEVVL